jgi:hypothetical protein
MQPFIERRIAVRRTVVFGTMALTVALIFGASSPADLLGQSPKPKAQAAVPSWGGPFWGMASGQIMRALFEEVDGGVQGEMRDASGYLYQILAQTADQYGAGVLVDPQTGAQMVVELQLSGDSLAVAIRPMADDAAQASPLQILLFRGEPPAEALGPSATQPQRAPTAPADPQAAGAATGDTRLVGSWQYSQSYTSGDFSMVTIYNFSLLPDGHFLYGSGGTQGGGNAGSLGSQGQVTNRGRWRPENNVLLLDEGAGWQPYARFVVDAQQMMLIFGDDSRQLWQRIAY